MRWRKQLSKFPFDIIHRARVKHQAADVLSRLPTNVKDDSPLRDGLLLFAIHAKRANTSILVNKTYTDDIVALNGEGENLTKSPPALEKQIANQLFDENSKVASLKVGHVGSKLNIDNR